MQFPSPIDDKDSQTVLEFDMTQEMTGRFSFFLGALSGVFMVGGICGLLPLITGLWRTNRHIASGSRALDFPGFCGDVYEQAVVKDIRRSFRSSQVQSSQ